MIIDYIFWAVTGGLVGMVVGMFLMLCRIGRDMESLYDTAFDSGVAYEKETRQIAELLRKKDTRMEATDSDVH